MACKVRSFRESKKGKKKEPQGRTKGTKEKGDRESNGERESRVVDD